MNEIQNEILYVLSEIIKQQHMYNLTEREAILATKFWLNHDIDHHSSLISIANYRNRHAIELSYEIAVARAKKLAKIDKQFKALYDELAQFQR